MIDAAQKAAGYGGTVVARADSPAIISNRAKLEAFGCFGAEGMAELRKGHAPTILKGEHAGDSIALDHVLPRSVVPELAARYYNLEAIPSKVNLAKSDHIGKRELDLARQWQKEGLISVDGKKAVESACLMEAK